MAMRFAQANRSETPDILNATVEQGKISAALRAAEMAQKQGYLTAASQFAQLAPEGAWGEFGASLMGAEAAPVVAGAEAAPVVAGAGSGAGSALASLGPMGWAALAALALGATR